jgi:hypothetical protein
LQQTYLDYNQQYRALTQYVLRIVQGWIQDYDGAPDHLDIYLHKLILEAMNDPETLLKRIR